MNNNLAYQDDFVEKCRKEVIDGKLVMMSPRPTVNHNRVAFNIAVLFDRYLKGKKCTPFSDGVDLYLDDNNRFVPDMMVVCDPDKIKPDGIHGTPDLVVEVLSPSTMRNDKTRKKDIYARCGVREYWLVSPEEKSVEIYRINKSEFNLHSIYVLHPGSLHRCPRRSGLLLRHILSAACLTIWTFLWKTFSTAHSESESPWGTVKKNAQKRLQALCE